MPNENYYKILEIDVNASLDDIKKSFRRLSLKLHPDKNENSLEKTESFRKIVEAYKTLSDPDKKVNYDRYNNINPDLNAANPDQNPNQNPNQTFQIDPNEMIKMMFQNPYFNDLANDLGERFENNLKNKDNISSNFISQLFNQTNPHLNNRFRQRPKSIKKNIEISLEQAFTGCTIPITIERTIRENGFKKEETETLYITIPKGIDNNEMIVLKSMGNVINDNYIGDVKITISVKQHESFIRIGLDLIYTKNITFKESLCGFSFTLNHINNKSYKFNNETTVIFNNNNSNNKIINGLGLIREGYTGNLVIKFNIIYPERLTAEQIDKLREIL